jgi:CBS domain-containing protein
MAISSFNIPVSSVRVQKALDTNLGAPAHGTLRCLNTAPGRPRRSGNARDQSARPTLAAAWSGLSSDTRFPGAPSVIQLERSSSMSQALNAGDMCNRTVVIADRRMSIVQAAQLMRAQHVGSLVVVDELTEGRRPVGMLTDRDIVTAVVAKEVDPATVCVEDLMSADVVTALETDSMTDMLATMRRKGLRRLPVINGKGVLIGLVTMDDMLAIQAEQLTGLVQAIESEARRERERRQ